MRSDLTTMSQREITRLQAMQRLENGGLRQRDVAAQLGLTTRQVKRLWRAYRLDGAAGLVSKKRGKPGNHRTDSVLLARALELIATRYPDFGPTLASEKLAERDGISIPKETLRTAMIAAKLWKPRGSKRKPAHPPRERRACFGELVQIDGSHHRWFEDRAPKCTLLVFVDDATSRLMGLRFTPAETTQSYFDLVDEYLRTFGKPMTFYSDRFGVFRVNQPTTGEGITQFGRAMEQLGIESICANSPQAKGRVERANGVLQDRLVKELRLQEISTIEAANAFVATFMAGYNARFAVAARSEIDVHRPLEPHEDLDRILCISHTRVVSQNLTVQYGSSILQITEKAIPQRLRSSQVDIREHRNGTITIERRGQRLAYRLSGELSKQTRVVGAKQLNDETKLPRDRNASYPQKAHPFPPGHPWTRKARRSSNQLEGDTAIGPDGDIIALS